MNAHAVYVRGPRLTLAGLSYLYKYHPSGRPALLRNRNASEKSVCTEEEKKKKPVKCKSGFVRRSGRSLELEIGADKSFVLNGF